MSLEQPCLLLQYHVCYPAAFERMSYSENMQHMARVDH
jgi:hypothetical protein